MRPTQQVTDEPDRGRDGPLGTPGQHDALRTRPVPAGFATRAIKRKIDSESVSDEVPIAIRSVLNRVAVDDHVTSTAFADAFVAAVELPAPTRDVVLGSLMMAVMTRGPVADDVEALLRAALSVDGQASAELISGCDRPVLMLAGSGKKGVRTLNVSTPAALVAAAAGARVIKVGSAATSSALGSRDLVRAFGLAEHRTAEGVRAELDASGFAFVAIEPEVPVLDGLYGGRFHAPNPFSFGLAPLASPVRGDVTVFGLSHPRVDVATNVLARFGMDNIDVLSTRLPSGQYLDEIGLVGQLRRCQARDGEIGPVETKQASSLTEPELPGDLPTPLDADEAIERTGELLAGGGLDSHRAVVALNAAHLLMVGGVVTSLARGIALAEDVLRSGATLANAPAARAAESGS